MSATPLRSIRHTALAFAAVGLAALGGPSLAEEDSPPSTPAQRIVEFTTPRRPAVGANRQERDAAEALKRRLREGTHLKNVTGRFRQAGDSLIFVDDENRELGGLPNLNLERIARMLQSVEEPESVSWSISGTVTEYSGKNHLLITRAVFRSAAPPPTPEMIAE
jgi:hypothetical protein